MKKVNRLEDALVMQANDMYQAERRLLEAIPQHLTEINDHSLKNELLAYRQAAKDKMLKLERIFSYLMVEPNSKRNLVIDSLISKTDQLLELAANRAMCDVLMATCIRTINHYKIAGYETACAFAEELGLDTPEQLLNEIVNWEKAAERTFSKIATQGINLRALKEEVA
jgi:ferritin-like metal-binding protein YciE